MKIRKAAIEDLSAIVNIYNEVIKEGGFTADLNTFSIDERRDWFNGINNKDYGIYVVMLDKKVIGYFHFSPWRKGREALKDTVELTFYLDKKHRGKGLGLQIVDKAIEIGKKKGFSNLLAILLNTNLRSRKLLERKGFEVVGTLLEVAKIDGEKIGQYIMQLRINP